MRISINLQKDIEMVKEFLSGFYETVVYAIGVKTFKVKIVGVFMYSLLFSPIAYMWDFARGYLLPEASFLKTVIVLCFIDAAIGIWKSWKSYNFNWLLLLIGLTTKLMVSYLAMLVFKSLTSPIELQNSQDFQMYFILTGKLMIMLYPAKSAFDNLFYVSEGKFPPEWYMNRMHNFERNGDIDKLLGKDKQTTENEAA